MSFPKMGKTLPNFLVDKGVEVIVANALRHAHKNDSSAVKKIARATGVNMHTAKKWYEAKTAPKSAHLLILAACYPAIQEELNKLVNNARDFAKSLGQNLPFQQVKTGNKMVDKGKFYTDKNVGINVESDLKKAIKLNPRQIWFMEQLQNGRKLKTKHIAEFWLVSARTAERDISALTKIGVVNYSGAQKDGFYCINDGRKISKEV